MRSIALLALALSVAVVLGQDASPCNGKSQGDCEADRADRCVWCTSAAVKSACYSEEQAAKLPAAVFKCAATNPLLGGFVPSPCNDKAQSECTPNADDDECVWCKSASVKSACYSKAQSSMLPVSVFQCVATSLRGSDLLDTPCNGKSQGDCEADTADECVWCTSAAVKPACYSKEQAAKLPAAVFKCAATNPLLEGLMQVA